MESERWWLSSAGECLQWVESGVTAERPLWVEEAIGHSGHIRYASVMLITFLALVAAPTQLPTEDFQEVLASWEAGQMHCERGNKAACAEQKAYVAKMRGKYGLCPSRTGERGALVVCKTGKKVDVTFD